MAEQSNAARDGVLGAIRKAASHLRDETAARAAVEERLSTHARNLLPARGQIPHAERVELFIRMAQAVAASVERVPERNRIPQIVADYLSAHNLPARLRAAPDPELQSLDWSGLPTLEVAFGRGEPEDQATITLAIAGIAETGTLFGASGNDAGPTLSFLPGTHIVVLPVDRVVGSYEEAWDLLRQRQAAKGLGMPRAVNFITGPSRTADIEQTSLVHVHGPGRLHILLVDSAADAPPQGS